MVTIEQLAAKYPRLWHMADSRNLPGILERGLLCTSALLDLLAIAPAERTRYERERRPDDVVFDHAQHGIIVLRDQRPLSVARLSSVLTEGTVEEFLAFINRRVFFWPTEERLKTMNGARAYQDRTQLVLVVATLPLLRGHEARLLLSPINSGSTTRFAVNRSIATFQSPNDYDWTGRRREVAEVTIADGVGDVWRYVERVELWRNAEPVGVLDPPYDESMIERVGA
jgi:hypothetical protein